MFGKLLLEKKVFDSVLQTIQILKMLKNQKFFFSEKLTKRKSADGKENERKENKKRKEMQLPKQFKEILLIYFTCFFFF